MHYSIKGLQNKKKLKLLKMQKIKENKNTTDYDWYFSSSQSNIKILSKSNIFCIKVIAEFDIIATHWTLNDSQLPVQSDPITTKVVSSNLVHGEVYSIQHYVIKFVSDLQ